MQFLIIMALMLGVMYVLMIRPQRQRQAQQQSMIDNAAVGDDVLTTGGIYGTITEVEGDESRVRTETRTKADGDHDRVGAANVVLYDLSPRAGVNLAAHSGQQVQLTAIVLERGKGDADVKIKEDTKVDREHAPDSKSKTESKITVDRGNGPRLNVISVKPLGQPCT